MQSDSAPLPAPEPRASATTSVGGGQQASAPGATGKSEAGHGTCTKAPLKPSISKVILRTVADKGTHNLVSLAALKSAVAAVGYDVIRNAWRVKRALKKLVDQGMLQQVTSKGALGSFRLGQKASKPKLKAKRPRRRRSRRCRAGLRGRPGRRPFRQRQSLLGSTQGHQRLGSMTKHR